MLCRFVLLTSIIVISKLDAACNPKLPNCKDGGAPSGGQPKCNPFYLIPGRANECTRGGPNKVLSIDSSSIQITPTPIKLPGCFTMSTNIEILPSAVPRNFVSKIEYSWVNEPQFSNLPCQNQTSDGCGGYGNNCYYCDICNSLTELKTNNKVNNQQMIKQFTDISCPTKQGIYQLKREFCFNDFKDFDKDHDCHLDFLQNNQVAQPYKEALNNIQLSGYGTVLAKFILANNASDDQVTQKKAKEKDIEKSLDVELEKKRQENNWAVNAAEYITFKNWYIQFRKDQWHKSEYLPWLTYTNEIGCLTVSFTVCDKEPTSVDGQTWQCPQS
jgi:hypothetical protein